MTCGCATRTGGNKPATRFEGKVCEAAAGSPRSIGKGSEARGAVAPAAREAREAPGGGALGVPGGGRPFRSARGVRSAPASDRSPWALSPSAGSFVGGTTAGDAPRARAGARAPEGAADDERGRFTPSFYLSRWGPTKIVTRENSPLTCSPKQIISAQLSPDGNGRRKPPRSTCRESVGSSGTTSSDGSPPFRSVYCQRLRLLRSYQGSSSGIV